MKKDFSFYEFVGILTPSAILLYVAHLIYEFVEQKQIVDFSKIGETVIFVVVCYGVGHILQAFGNIFENVIWFIYKGMPSKWLTNENRFGKNLFDDESLNSKIAEKVKTKFGEGIEDYGKITYNYVFQKTKIERIDIFNGNYSLFRGLAVSFLIISGLCFYFLNWKIGLVSIVPFLLATFRMIRFGKYYATETFRTFYNLE